MYVFILHIFLFILYGVAIGYAITKIPFFRNSGIKPAILLSYFGLRTAIGCLHNIIAYRYYPNHGDIWRFFNHSFITRKELLTDFHSFWADNSVLAYLPHNLIEWMHVLFNWLSFDNLYINTLLFSFITVAGAIAFFRVFIGLFPGDFVTACCVLLLPSTLFWTTCIHTEGILFTVLGFYFYNLHRLLNGTNQPLNGVTQQFKGATHPLKNIHQPLNDTRQSLLCFFLFLIAAFFRPAILVGLLPATLFWILATNFSRRQNQKASRHPDRDISKNNRRLALLGLSCMAAIALLIFMVPGLSTALLQYLSTRQQEFQVLTGNSRIYLPVLAPTLGSFAHILPWAFLNGFFQPLPGSGGQAIYMAFAAELILIWIIVIAALLRMLFSSHTNQLSPFGISCLLFSVIGMLLIGYIIPFIGSIIRYRSVFLPFLIAPFLHALRHTRLPAALNPWLKKNLLKP